MTEALELVASETSTLFFNLATAQTNLDIATYNYASADTLYRYAEGRYNIGTITENEIATAGNKQTDRRNQYDECPYRSRGPNANTPFLPWH